MCKGAVSAMLIQKHLKRRKSKRQREHGKQKGVKDKRAGRETRDGREREREREMHREKEQGCDEGNQQRKIKYKSLHCYAVQDSNP